MRLTQLGICLLALAGSMQAAPVIYFGENQNPVGAVSGAPVTARANFLAALSGVGNENFEGFAAGTLPPLALSFPGSAGNITATVATPSGGICGTGSGTVGNIGCYPFGRFATSGTQFYHTTDQFTITFSTAISAFGFYMTDIGDISGQMTLTLAVSGGGSPVVVTVPTTINAANGTLGFFGFIDSSASYTSITFGNTAAGEDVFGFDDMVVGDAQQVVGGSVPEPSAAMLMVPALGLLAYMRRRR